MSIDASVMHSRNASLPTFIRHFVLSVVTLMSVLLYLDRYAVNIAAKFIRVELQMTETQMAWFIGAFFWSYALCQVPAGWLSDRFGARRMLTIYILAWSVFTGAMGLVHVGATGVSHVGPMGIPHVVWLMLLLRLCCGVAQAGAYPTSAGLIRQWYPISFRGTASSIVGLGGRFGAVLAPTLTATLMVGYATEQSSGWRPTIILYGIVGIVVALIFLYVTCNTPQSHSWCNEAEHDLINDEASRILTSSEPRNPSFPWWAFLANLSLWGNSLMQFLTNVGWFFVVSSLPRYLDEVHHVPLFMQGVMTAFPSAAGILALFAGGRCTDLAVRRFGLKWGRRVPVVLSRFTAAGGYGLCLLLGMFVAPGLEKVWLPWLYIFGLCVAAGSTDFGTPAIWSYAQDVGGRYTASILGWANMWGNLGAAVAPLIYDKCLGETPSIGNWNVVFAICCVAFVFAGLFGMLLDATKPLTVER